MSDLNHAKDAADAADAIAALMRGRRTLAVTGAGISTDAGIPDYRGVGTTPVEPVDYDQFVTDPVWYRWVWARNHATWRLLDPLTPTPGHTALARLEEAGLVTGVATQNVDRLHSRAGQRTVWELHGAYDRVVCLTCGRIVPRAEVDARLTALNPDYPRETDPARVAITPEADRAAAEACDFETVLCEVCDGPLKPDIVFFGEGLPAAMGEAMDAAERCDVVLVAGTSLAVLTGLWIVRQAMARGAALVVINRGPTAVDEVADVRVQGGTSQALAPLARALGA
ncbi:NAD-dependent deacetylase [Actinomyces israelii]|uniref:protein acetyllysine N-acetyltransferase n=1 Tax=Actinomyces israelii TaxID=1659 RepID=A0ABT4ICF0_9ACTO|nr:Sir2 family NAD-dependent protein deacetylase [Actinomyces israelii]MCZ0859415.1 NAD-dependent deacetylase [Actinomyces israelii]WKR23111.1 NAD-dependent protein deacetylase [Actinomyces israelii]